MDKWKFIKDVVFIVFPFMVLMYLIIPHFLYESNQYFSFSGSPDVFNFGGVEFTGVLFKANKIYMAPNDARFESVKNITIKGYNGSEKINSGIIWIQSCNEKSTLLISGVNAEFDLDFENLYFDYDAAVFKNDYTPSLYAVGDSITNSYFRPNGGKVTVQNGCIVKINENTPRFQEISFEMDNSSFIDFGDGRFMVNAYGISDLIIQSDNLSELHISQSNGKLGLENHLFDINSADKINIKVLSISSSHLRFQNKAIVFNGLTNSVKFNDRNIIMSDFSYWLEYQPEKINGFGVLVTAYLALLGIYLPSRNGAKKQELQETKNS